MHRFANLFKAAHYFFLFLVFYPAIFLGAANIERKVLCPVCRIEFSALKKVSAEEKPRYSIDGQRLDQKMAPLPECPLCGGIFHDEAYAATEIKKLETLVWSKEYQQLRQNNRWQRYAFIREKMNADYLELARLWLQAAWAENSKFRRDYLTKSLEYYQTYFLANQGQSDLDLIQLRVADILRQLGRFDEAMTALPDLKNADDHSLKRLYRLETELIAQKNSRQAEMPDGNALHQAISENNVEALRDALGKDYLLNERNLAGDAPLHLAIEKGDFTAVKTLLAAGANPGQKNHAGQNAIHLAARLGFLQAFIELLATGADLKERDSGGNSLLHLVCAGTEPERVSMAQMLMTRGIDTDARNFADLTALHVAATSGSRELLELLLKNGVRVDARVPDGGSALFFCRNGFIEVLVDYGADLKLENNHGQTAFTKALLEGDRERVAFFKRTGHFGTVSETITVSGQKTDLWVAAASANHALLREVLRLAPQQLNQREIRFGETPLHAAVLAEQAGSVEILLEAGADPNSANDFRRTPLHYAAMKGNLRLTKILVDAGANIFALDVRGSTALHEAAAVQAVDVYRLLVANGASDSTRNNAGISAAELLKK
jgi:ankyrin repeat protein